MKFVTFAELNIFTGLIVLVSSLVSYVSRPHKTL